MNFKSLIAWK